MSKLLTRPSGLLNIFWYFIYLFIFFIDIRSTAQEECDLPGSKKNSRVLYGRKHLRLYCMESESNQSRPQIQSSDGETDPIGINWLAKVSRAPEKTTLYGISTSTNSKKWSYK